MKKLFNVVFCLALGALISLSFYAWKEKKAIADKVLRLHIVAESNSEYDQMIKLEVRDAVLKEASRLFNGAENKAEALSMARENKSLFEDAAKKVLKESGCNLPVTVEVEKTRFPLKFYENIRLPAGVYDALNVKIGTGKGENWWCIMYPALCFVNGISGKMDYEGEKQLKEELGEERFRLVTDTDDRKIRIKFRILEIF